MIINNQLFREKILIVDDSPESIDILVNAIPKHYKRQAVLNGETALKILDASDDLPGLILLDVMMPGMNGYEVCRRIKADKRLKDIPVIFLSSLIEVQDKVEAFSKGGADYITKPFKLEEVQARVNTHLKLHYYREELKKYNENLKQRVEEKVKEISELQMETIYALAKLTESRDEVTGGHIERVQECCRLIAGQLGMYPKYKNMISAEFVDSVQKASSLHDIGKVGIRDSILLKTGKLTPEEVEEMKQHTLIGANTLKEVYQKYPANIFIKIGIEVARSHHEKWDGSGYPNGLAGDRIPLSARIMALADVYDALLSKRPYKEPYSNKEAHEIIVQGSGKHFDPLIVKTFLDIEKDINVIYANLEN